MRALDDDEHLAVGAVALAELVDPLVGAAHVGEEREVVAVGIQQHRVVRRDEPRTRAAHDGGPRVPVDEAADLGDVLERE